MKDQLTIHIINELPWSNLNRDDTGLPKRMLLGGKQRGVLSSQSIKRGARTKYEDASLDLSVRSANLADLVVQRALQLNAELDEKQAARAAKKIIGALTKASEKSTESEAGRSAWLSEEELESAAQIVSLGEDAGEFVAKGESGSLAIAAFGRMFAARPELQTEAAISVSPAVSTHETAIETDYFTTMDENPTAGQGKGAAYLGIAHYISGVFYRTVTIDRKQLQRSWSGSDSETAQQKLEQLVTALIYGMPRGKEKSTAPYTAPALVLVETQEYRVAYDFETPVLAAPDGGFLAATIQRLQEERAAAHRFDPENFGGPEAIAGTYPDLGTFQIRVTDRKGIAEDVAIWALQ